MSTYKLYKFREVNTNSISSLANSTLWFSSLADFNDPFEGTLVRENNLTTDDLDLCKSHIDWNIEISPSDPDFIEICSKLGLDPNNTNEQDLMLNGLSRELDDLIKIIHDSKFLCLSQRDQDKDPILENLMWSHYAQGLRGYCLVFNNDGLQADINASSNKKMRGIKVSYQVKPNKITLSEFLRSDMWVNENKMNYIQTITETIATKSESWSYENEMRILTLESSARVHKYSPDSLEEVVLGDKMSAEHKELVLSILHSKYPNTKIKVAKLIPSTYQIEICENA